MKKYLTIYKTSLIDSIKYISSILFKFVSYFITMFIMFELWNYIYSDTSKIIAGYTLKQMIWYILFTEIITYGTDNKEIINGIIGDIKGGNIAYQLNKPYHYLGYQMASYFGDSTIKIILYLIVSITLGLLFVGPINMSIIHIPLYVIVFILAFIINASIKITISLISFWIEDATPFHWLYNKILLILGVFFPIEMFPVLLRPIISFTPVYAVIYGLQN